MYIDRDADSSWRVINWWSGGLCREKILFSTRPKSSNKRNKTK
jgi:hypothetical protein